jgi:phosphoethanolamine N-methyltransferase
MSTAEPATNPAQGSTPTYDNNGQYTRTGILRYEKVFGDGYVSTGGHDTTLYLVEKLGDALRPGARVLDVGSGIGGAAFFLADTYGAKVVGVDLAPEMVAIAQERARRADGSESVRFILADVLDEQAVSGPFDVAWSRDALMHVHDKRRLFRRLFDLLAPGGTLVVTDYARGEGPASPEFEAYIAKTGYHVVSPLRYGELLADAGFADVQVEDATPRFVEILKGEMDRLNDGREEFLKVFSESDLDYILDRWAMKVGFCDAGDMKWGIYRATRPA